MNYNKFEQFLQILEKQQPQQPRIVRQNEYFSVIDEGQLNENGKPNQWFKVQLKGLLNPKLSLIQSYKLLNPFDEIIYMQNIKSQIYYYYEPQSKHVRQFLWEIQKLNPTEKIKYSMFFLYYLKKLYNTIWRRCGNDVAKLKGEIENLQIKLLYGFYKMKIQINLYQTCLLFKLLQFQRLPTTINDRNYHTGMQQFLLYKLYKTYGISCEWSDSYQKKLLQIDEESFEQLYEFELNLKQHIIDYSLIEKSIIQHRFYCNNQHQHQITQARQVVSYLLENLRNYQLPIFYTYTNKQEFQIFGLKVRMVKKEQNNLYEQNNAGNYNQQLVNTAQKIYQKYIKDESKLRQTQYFGLRNLFPHSQCIQRQPIYLRQLQPFHHLYNSSSQMFANLVPTISIDYFQWFRLFRKIGFEQRSEGQLQMKNTLMWRDSIGSMEYDRLQLWRLLFAMEYSPVIVCADEINVAMVAKLEPSLRNVVLHTMMNVIKNELQPIIIPHMKMNSNHSQIYNQHHNMSSYIQIIPFISLLILAYELYSLSVQSAVNQFVDDIKAKYKQEKLGQNIKQLAKDLHRQFITKNIAKKLTQQTQQLQNNCQMKSPQQSRITNNNNNNNNKLQTYSNQLILALIHTTNQIDQSENQFNQ